MRIRTLALAALAAVALTAVADENFSYVYSRDGQNFHMRGEPIRTIERMAKHWKGEYIWINRGGKQYLIRDAAVLAQVRVAFAEWDAMEPAMRAAEKRFRPFEQKYDDIEERMDAVSDQLDDEDLSDSARQKLEDRLQAIEDELHAAEREMQTAEDEVERLERELDQREKVAERRFEQIVIRAIDSGKAERLD